MMMTTMMMQINAAKQHKKSVSVCWEQYHDDDGVDVDDNHRPVYIDDGVDDSDDDDDAKKRSETT